MFSRYNSRSRGGRGGRRFYGAPRGRSRYTSRSRFRSRYGRFRARSTSRFKVGGYRY